MDLRNGVKQAVPRSSLRLDDGRIAEREGIDQTGPGLEASHAAAANPPAADGSFRGFVGTRKHAPQMGNCVVQLATRIS